MPGPSARFDQPGVRVRGAVGSTVPPLMGTSPSGRAVPLLGDRRGAAGSGASAVLCFLSDDCMGCRPFWEMVADPGPPEELGRIETVVVVKHWTRGSPSDEASAIEAHGGSVVVSPEAWDALGVLGYPHAIVVDGSGIVRARGDVFSLEDLEALVADAG